MRFGKVGLGLARSGEVRRGELGQGKELLA